MALLPHRALPGSFTGGGYHVITVYRIDDETETALIGDLADDPVTISLVDLAQARCRIKKQKNRVLSAPGEVVPKDLAGMIREGLRNCHQGRPGIGSKVMVNFTLDAFRVWGSRMHASKDKESWERIFTRGGRLWRGLTAIYDGIEHYGTGGGLCRPIFAEFLAEAAEALGVPPLRTLAGQFADLGRQWSELADAAASRRRAPLPRSEATPRSQGRADSRRWEDGPERDPPGLGPAWRAPSPGAGRVPGQRRGMPRPQGPSPDANPCTVRGGSGRGTRR